MNEYYKVEYYTAHAYIPPEPLDIRLEVGTILIRNDNTTFDERSMEYQLEDGRIVTINREEIQDNIYELDLLNFDLPERVDSRSNFANDVCQLLADKLSGFNDSCEVIKLVEPMYENFDEHVRNVYELIGNHIPLFKLYEIYKEKYDYGQGNWDWTKEQYKMNLEITIKACIFYYQ